MDQNNINSPLPIKNYGPKNGSVRVPLDQAIADPKSVINTTKKTYLPIPTRVPGDTIKKG